MKPLPAIVTVVAPAPAVAVEGKIEATAGGGVAGTANGAPLDAPPAGAGFTTVMGAVPTGVKLDAGIAAVTSVELIKLVASATPFHSTCDAVMNPLPATDRVKALELMLAADGEMDANDGAGLAVIAKVWTPDAPPPGVGLIT